MSEEDARKIAEQALEARVSSMSFIKWIWPGYETPPHIVKLNEALDAVIDGDINRLMVKMPPRHGKSTTVSRHFPAYFLCRYPEKHVIHASYGAELAHEFGGEARNVFNSEMRREIFPEVEIDPERKAQHRWRTSEGGGLVSAGIPGPITGRGADLLNIDDPIRGWEDAESELKREAVWQWFKSDARTRLEPGGAIVVTFTPWHEDDLGGRILNSDEQNQYVQIEFPALDGSGAALWPERFDEAALAELRKDVGERAFQALYMLQPAPEEGLIFKWFPEHDDPDNVYAVLMPIDTAWTERSDSDYTAVTAWGLTPSGICLLDGRRWQVSAPVAQENIFKFWTEMMWRYPNIPITPLVREGVAIDRIMAQHLQMRRVPVVPVKLPKIGGGSKVKAALARIVVDYFQSGIARIPRDISSRIPGWLPEHKSFDTGKHDDYVETTIIVLHYFRNHVVNIPKQTFVVPQEVGV